VEWSGVEWSGVEWSGVEWSGVEWPVTRGELCTYWHILEELDDGVLLGELLHAPPGVLLYSYHSKQKRPPKESLIIVLMLVRSTWMRIELSPLLM